MRFQKVYVEIGNACNLQCSFCPEVRRPKELLGADRLREILRQVKPLTERVAYHLMGEPTAHPDFPLLVDLAQSEAVRIEITTNGTLLRPEVVNALLSPAVAQVNFSLQSFPDNFPSASIERWLQGIAAFTRRALADRPDLYVNFRLWNLESGASTDRHNEALLLWIEREFGVPIRRRVDPRLIKSKKLAGRLYLHHDTRFTWPSLQAPPRRSTGTCHGGTRQIGIHVDGTVVPCCLDKEADIPLGNVRGAPLSEILGGSRLARLTAGFQRGELVEDLCRTCGFAERFGG